MDKSNLVAICGLAFLTVFVLLAVLALAMRALTAAFPGRHAEPEPRPSPGSDPALAAAVVAAVTTLSPGARVVTIEEIPCS